jgi:hypothetical protein
MDPALRRTLHPKLRALVETDRNSRPVVERLTPAEIDILTDIARGVTDFDVPVRVPSALAALATAAPADRAVPVIAGVLADRRRPAADRIAAAHELGRVADPGAERALLSQIGERDPRVLQAVLAALGTFAGLSARPALDALAAPADLATRRQLLFARVLIARRNGLAEPSLPTSRTMQAPSDARGQATAVALEAEPPQAAAANLGRLRGSRYGTRIRDHAYALRCGATEWTIFVHEELGDRSTLVARLYERPWIASILAQWLPGREATQTRLVLMTRPAGRKAHIDIVRPDGEVIYAGTAQRSGSSAAFTISAVDRPGAAPTTVSGRLTPAGVELRRGIAATSRTGVQKAAPVIPPRSTAR